MKVILNLPLAVIFILCLFFCPRDNKLHTAKEPPVISYRSNTGNRSANIIPQGQPRERPENMTPEQQEEIRRRRNSERAVNTGWIKDCVKKYSPGSWYMLMQYDRLPESTEISASGGGSVSSHKAVETFQYLRGRSRIDLLASMETNVHEITHAYFDQNTYRYLKEEGLKMNTENAQGYIYISPSRSFFVSFPFNAMFPSADLADAITDDLRTYRFDTYIGGTTSTQSDGIIGLLNELNAYYIGSEYCFNMLEPYKEAAGSEAAGLFEWVTHTQSTMSAFYEFDYFIKEYLLNMKKNHEADYEMLKAYPPFAEAYETLCKLYLVLIEKYQARIKAEMKLLESSGEAGTKIEKGWLWVKAGNSHISSGTPIFSKEKETLTPVLESRRYREIAKDFPLN